MQRRAPPIAPGRLKPLESVLLRRFRAGIRATPGGPEGQILSSDVPQALEGQSPQRLLRNDLGWTRTESLPP